MANSTRYVIEYYRQRSQVNEQARAFLFKKDCEKQNRMKLMATAEHNPKEDVSDWKEQRAASDSV